MHACWLFLSFSTLLFICTRTLSNYVCMYRFHWSHHRQSDFVYIKSYYFMFLNQLSGFCGTFQKIKTIVCGVVWDGVHVFVFMFSHFLHIITLGPYSLQMLNLRTSTSVYVYINLTEVTIGSLTLSTVHQVALFHVSLSTISGLWYPELLVKWTETLLPHHCWVHCHLHL